MKLLSPKVRPNLQSADYVYFSSDQPAHENARGAEMFRQLSTGVSRSHVGPTLPDWIVARTTHLAVLYVNAPPTQEVVDFLEDFCRACPVIVDVPGFRGEQHWKHVKTAARRADHVTVGPAMTNDWFDKIKECADGRASRVPDWYVDDPSPFERAFALALSEAVRKVRSAW